MQEPIMYGDIMSLGFKEEFADDRVYLKQYGYPYSIITFKLTKKIFLEWDKPTQFCSLVRVDSKRKCNILKEVPVYDIEELKKIIYFFEE